MRIYFLFAFCLLNCIQARGQSAATPAGSFGKNIIAIAPLQAKQPFVAGIGLHYERMLGKQYKSSFYLPVAFSFYDYSAYNLQTGKRDSKKQPVLYLYPGFKFYPAGNNRDVSYSIGPSLVIGIDYHAYHTKIFAPHGSQGIITDEKSTRLGIMLNNGLNVQATPAFYLGWELGIGFSFFNTAPHGIPALPLYQLNFKGGYRF